MCAIHSSSDKPGKRLMHRIIMALCVDDNDAALRYCLITLIVLVAVLAMLPELPGAFKSG
jgi:hypothetical protein